MRQHLFVRWTNRFGAILTILGLTLAPALLGSCGGVDCSSRGFDATFVGRLTAVHTATGTFMVESVQVEQRSTHVPTVGTLVAVRYADGQERFLRVGKRYRVAVSWNGKEFESGVHVANEPCSRGTLYADGSAIDTARDSWLKVHRALAVLALAPVVAFVILSAWLWRRRRRSASLRVDDRRE